MGLYRQTELSFAERPAHGMSWRLGALALVFGLAAGPTLAFAPHGLGAVPAPIQRVQADDGSAARLAVAGRKLAIHADAKPGSRTVGHLDNGAEVIITQTQGGWAKVEDYQTGHPLGWVNRLLLLNPAQ